MGAREKLNQSYVVGVVAVATVFGLMFASLDLAILLGLILFVAAVTAGDVRLSCDNRYRPSGRSRQRRR